MTFVVPCAQARRLIPIRMAGVTRSYDAARSFRWTAEATKRSRVALIARRSAGFSRYAACAGAATSAASTASTKTPLFTRLVCPKLFGPAAAAPEPAHAEDGQRRVEEADQQVDDVVVRRVDDREALDERIQREHGDQPPPAGLPEQHRDEEEDEERVAAVQRRDGRIGVLHDDARDRERAHRRGQRRRSGGAVRDRELADRVDHPGLRGRPRRRGRVEQERDRARVGEDEHRRSEAVEERAALDPEDEGEERRHDEVELRDLDERVVVPARGAVPQPVLEVDRGHVSAEEKTFSIELREVEGVRTHEVRNSARLRIQDDQEREGDEIERKPSSPPQDERRRQEDDEIAVRRQAEAEERDRARERDREGR